MTRPIVPAPARRKPTRYRRRLRSRIVLSFLLLGFGLTLLLAVATNWARSRVENQLVEDLMNRNIDEYARRYYADPGHNPAVPVEQIRAYAFAPDSERLQRDFPEWKA
ncbi:MAG: two-component sensor histidine kinase, partial [Lysobacteraceae bacterium]